MKRTRFHRGTRGVSVVIMGVFLVVLMGMAALAVDLGMLQKTRAEAQRAADAAALAGASAFLIDLDNAARGAEAIVRTKDLASRNTMAGTPISVTEVGSCDPPPIPVDDDGVAPDDGTPDLTAQTCEVSIGVWYPAGKVPPKVRVRVRRAVVSTWFARVFGKDAFPVGARAAAVADYASGTKCVKPIAVPDLWDDAGDLNGNHRFDLNETWLWNGAPTPDVYHEAHYAGEGSGTGLGSDLRNTYAFERDWGLRIVLRPDGNVGDPSETACTGTLQGGKCYVPSFWGMWGSTNTNTLGPWIRGCNETVYVVSEEYGVTAGWKEALARDVEWVYDQDPSAQWSSGATDPVTGKPGTVTNSRLPDWRQSPRVWIMAIMAPNEVPQVAQDKDASFNNFMLFFFEGCVPDDWSRAPSGNCRKQGANDPMLVGRFLGLAKGTETGPAPGTMTRILRLVE